MIDKLARLSEVFEKHKIRYLFIRRGGAILYGYPGTTQDIDIFAERTEINCKNLLDALKELGFEMDKQLEEAIASGKDFIQIRGGLIPFDLVFSRDGIESFAYGGATGFSPRGGTCVSVKHRLENPGIIPLQIIEVQNGDYV